MPPTTQSLASRIRTVRGQKVLLDSDLAALYGVATKALVQAVKRNLRRFPADFMFHFTEQELRALRSQIVTLDDAGGGTGGRGQHGRDPGFLVHGALASR